MGLWSAPSHAVRSEPSGVRARTCSETSCKQPKHRCPNFLWVLVLCVPWQRHACNSTSLSSTIVCDHLQR